MSGWIPVECGPAILSYHTSSTIPIARPIASIAAAATCSISSAQDSLDVKNDRLQHAAVVIQRTWRSHAARRDGHQSSSQLPAIPPLKSVSTFTLYGRPPAFYLHKRRIWFDTIRRSTLGSAFSAPAGALDGEMASPTAASEEDEACRCSISRPLLASAPTAPAPLDSNPSNSGAHACKMQRSFTTPVSLLLMPRAASGALVIRAPRADPDLPAIEVRQILDGGFWRSSEPNGGSNGGALHPSQVIRRVPSFVPGMSQFMQARARAAQLEAEEALATLRWQSMDYAEAARKAARRAKRAWRTVRRTASHAWDSFAGSVANHIAASGSSPRARLSAGPAGVALEHGMDRATSYSLADATIMPSTHHLLRVPLLHAADHASETVPAVMLPTAPYAYHTSTPPVLRPQGGISGVGWGQAQGQAPKPKWAAMFPTMARFG